MNKRFLLTSLVLFAVVFTQAQTADEVINKYLDVIGGTANWKKLTVKTASGKMTMMGMELPVTMYSKPVNKTKMTINFQGNEIITAYDGKEAWGINPMTGNKDPQIIPPDQAKEMTDDEFENEFIDYKKKGSTVKYTGTEAVDGVTCHKVELTRKGNTNTYYFDAENHVLMVVKSVLATGPAAGQEAWTYFSDYQDVNGLMIPFALEVKIGGQSFQRLAFDKVDLTTPLDDKIFAFPKK